MAADGVSPVIGETLRPVNVLLLFASPRLTPAQMAIDEAFRSTLTSRLSAPVYFYTEYLDLTLFHGDEPRPELRALLERKYRGVKLDLVVALASTEPTSSGARPSCSPASTGPRSATSRSATTSPVYG